MNIAPVRERLVRSVTRSWRTWLLMCALGGVAIDVAYHVYGPTDSLSSAEADFVVPVQQDAVVDLTAAQRTAAGIAVEPVALRPHAEIFRAPGEVQVNEYASSAASARLRATVISRSAKLGDRVRRGQTLAVLYSSDMAEAQTSFVLASRNFVRMSNLKAYIAGAQFDEAEVKRDEARGRLETFGLAAAEIDQLARDGLTGRPAGQFDLRASQDGVITTDTFRPGEVIEPGKELFQISDLSTVWVEAQVSPDIFPRIMPGGARVIATGKTYDARIVQSLELLNESTRTVGIRLQVPNTAGALRPGQYVNVELSSAAEPEIFVPTAAVLRDPDGNWMVYVENAQGAFQPVHVTPLHEAGEDTAISGVREGVKVVTKGAFFVKSEAEKSSFGGEE
jgi:RND family efflux transporter MFP subunit